MFDFELLKKAIKLNESILHDWFSMGTFFGGMVAALSCGIPEDGNKVMALCGCAWMMIWILIQMFYKRKETDNE